MAKRRKLRVSRLIILICGALAVCSLVWLVIAKMGKKNTADTDKEPVQEQTETEPQTNEDDGTAAVEEPPVEEDENAPETTTSATLFMVGDGLVHGAVWQSAEIYTGGNGFDFNHMFWRIGEIARNYDLRYYNQETILGGEELGLASFPLFNSPQEFGRDMVEEGFNLVSTATNHSADFGEQAIINSWNFWKSQEGVVMEGTNLSQEERDEIEIHEINGISYAFLSWTFSINGMNEPGGKSYMINWYEGHRDEMLDQVRRADEMADLVIMAIHWGVEYQMYPSEDQIQLAQELSDAGADIIIGNHPHVIQPVQWINGHKTICYYALGNMISAQFGDSLVGMMGGVTITKRTKGSKSEIELSDVKADLIYTFGEPTWLNIEVVPFAQMNDAMFPGYQEYYARMAEVITAMDDTIQVGGF